MARAADYFCSVWAAVFVAQVLLSQRPCSCFHEDGYKAENLLGHLFQLIMGGTFDAYNRCAPRRYIRRLDTGLIFDVPTKVVAAFLL